MSSLGINGAHPAARAARARELAKEISSASELLEFYAALIDQQRVLAAQVDGGREPGNHRDAGPLLNAIHAEWIGGAASDFVTWMSGAAPVALRRSLEPMREIAAEQWRQIFESYRSNPVEAADRFNETVIFILEAVLQPVAEHLARTRHARAERSPTSVRCPVCGEAPVVGVLREAGHGARRALVCGLCLTEWEYLRLVCVACGEQRFESLPIYIAEQFPHVRVEACDTCRRYLKTIDLTRDGRAVPVVDDVATPSLDLWARDKGYARIRANLVRV